MDVAGALAELPEEMVILQLLAQSSIALPFATVQSMLLSDKARPFQDGLVPTGCFALGAQMFLMC